MLTGEWHFGAFSSCYIKYCRLKYALPFIIRYVQLTFVRPRVVRIVGPSSRENVLHVH